MAITINDFTPSVAILDTDKIAQTDDKIRIVISEAKTYLETETQDAVNQLENKVDDKLTELASNPGVTYTPETIDQKIAESTLAHAQILGEVLVASGTNRLLINPVSFTKLTVENGAVLKLI